MLALPAPVVPLPVAVAVVPVQVPVPVPVIPVPVLPVPVPVPVLPVQVPVAAIQIRIHQATRIGLTSARQAEHTSCVCVAWNTCLTEEIVLMATLLRHVSTVLMKWECMQMNNTIA